MRHKGGYRILLVALTLLTMLKPGLSHSDSPKGSGYAQIGPLRMYYEVHGSGKPLLVLHGGGSTIGTTFGAILPELAAKRLVIAPEQQAHGHTADLDRPLSFDQMADDTAYLLGQLRIGKADVFGFSNGAGVAIELALRHPELVDRLVLGSIYYRRDSIKPELLEYFRNASSHQMPEVLRRAYLDAAPNPQDLAALTSKIMRNILAFEGWTEAQLGSIKVPTMIIQANNDVAPLEHAVKMAQLIPGAQILVMPGGHGSYLGEALAAIPGSRLPAYTLGIIMEFLDGN